MFGSYIGIINVYINVGVKIGIKVWSEIGD